MHLTKERRCRSVYRRKCVALLSVLFLLLTTVVSCKDQPSDDKTVTDHIIRQYLTALCEYDIKTMNQNSLSVIESYGDSKEINASCKVLAARISWQIEGISINGNAAIAQITLVRPQNFEVICTDALGDAMRQIEQNTERTPAQMLGASIKSRAEKTDAVQISVEIPMSKVADKWMIGKTHTIDGIISEIRTPTAAVYALIGQ